MIRSLATALLCAVAVVAGDTVFRTSLLQQLRPVILSPADQGVMEPPVQLQWQGPQRMRVLLSVAGGETEDLGIHESPFVLGNEEFPRDGGYRVAIEGLRFGRWIRASRWFQVHAAPEPATPVQDGQRETVVDTKNLLHALEAARSARNRAHQRTKFLSEENAALRDENDRLAAQLDALDKAREDDAAHASDLEGRLAQATDENRGLAEENSALRLRLGSVIPCTVWGYYSYPRPQTIPVTRRMLMVSDTRGRIFRSQTECELVRRADVTAVSVCFCVGNSWGGG